MTKVNKMTSQVSTLNKILAMYKNKQISLAKFRNAVMQCEMMYLENKENAQQGVKEKLAELQQIAKNL